MKPKRRTILISINHAKLNRKLFISQMTNRSDIHNSTKYLNS